MVSVPRSDFLPVRQVEDRGKHKNNIGEKSKIIAKRKHELPIGLHTFMNPLSGVLFNTLIRGLESNISYK